MNKKYYYKGFTVLEFLIVLSIILVLIAIILPNLQKARERSVDEKKISDIKTISLGIEQFKQACGTYPSSMDPLIACGDDATGNNNLGKFIPEISQYNFTNSSEPNYITYVPFALGSDDSECIAFHLGITLKNEITGIFQNGDANFDSTPNIGFPYILCGDSSATGFNGSQEYIYDIFKQ